MSRILYSGLEMQSFRSYYFDFRLSMSEMRDCKLMT